MTGRGTTLGHAVECWRRGATPAQRLICFAHAGAGAAAFQGWSSALPAQIEVCAVRLPGRERLIAQTPFEKMAPLIDWVVEVLAPVLASPFALFGHSLGALIAFELARELRRRNLPMPQSLLVSGYGAPQLPRRTPPLAGLSDAEFTARLEELEGTSWDVFADPELRALILPALRADFRMLEDYAYVPGPPLALPLRAFGGAVDPLVPMEDLEQWAKQTSVRFSSQLFPGHHFFLQTQRQAVLREISAGMAAAASDTGP